MSTIFVVDDDREWLGYYQRLFQSKYEVETFLDGVAVRERMTEVVPDILILDVLLTGPTGISILNEMQSYDDLTGVPVIIVSSAEIGEGLEEYGVVGVLDKGKMLPRELLSMVRKFDGQCKN
jgi:DNA-binding response OmpR family regulator